MTRRTDEVGLARAGSVGLGLRGGIEAVGWLVPDGGCDDECFKGLAEYA